MEQPWKVPCLSLVAGAAGATPAVVDVVAVVEAVEAAVVACAAVEDILGVDVGYPVVLSMSDAETGMDRHHMGGCQTLASSTHSRRTGRDRQESLTP